MKLTNQVFDTLVSLGITDNASVEKFYDKTRDRSDISVYRCTKTGTLFLSTTEHMNISYYNEKNGTQYWNSNSRSSGLINTAEDDERRFHQIKHLIANKNYLDIGTGLGGVLDHAKNYCKSIAAIEPQLEMKELLNGMGYSAYADLKELPLNFKADFISLFHVFEHLINPVEMLTNVHSTLNNGGKVMIEVPHANDILLTSYNIDSFKAFTFWSEHLVLHTRISITALLQKAGFKNIEIQGFQRYPLANHIHWMLKGKPGGQQSMNFLRTKQLDEAYASMLAGLDKTDTLIITAEK